MAVKKKNHTPRKTSGSAQTQHASGSSHKAPDTSAPSVPATPTVSISYTATVNRVESLEDVTGKMLRKLAEAVNGECNFILSHAGAPEQKLPYLKALHDINQKATFTIPETTIAFLSGVSGGKSSLLNIGICKYPIIPVATTETSTCAVEIRRVTNEQNERIEVCGLVKYGEKGAALAQKPLRIFCKQVLNEGLFSELYDYADYLMQKEILTIGDSLGFFRDENGKIRVYRNNWRHCMALLMVVLDAYVLQDRQEKQDQTEKYQVANQKRNALLNKLGIPLDKDYGIRLYWSSDRIPDHSVLVDLPGTGGTTQSQHGHLGHSALVSAYLSQVDSLICLFGGSAEINPESRNFISTFMETNELKGNSSTRITFVLNKADMFDSVYHPGNREGADQALRTSIDQFREKNSLCAEYPIYTLSTYDGELSLLDSGIPLENLHQASFRKAFGKVFGGTSTEDLLNFQKERYRRAFPCQMRKGDAFGEQTFQQFIDTLITEYIGRIHFLQSVECFREHARTLTSIAEVIHVQQDLLEMARKYSPELAQILVDSIEKSMETTIQDMILVMEQLEEDIMQNTAYTIKNIPTIVQSLEDDYRVLSQKINKVILDKVYSLETQSNGTIPICPNWYGGNSLGKRNNERLLSLGQDIAKIDFISQFNVSFQRLKAEFDNQRNVFNASLVKLCSELNAFPAKTVKTMESVFGRALQGRKLDQTVYSGAMDAAKETTYKLLLLVCGQYVALLKGDTSISQTMDETANRIQYDLLDILSVYTSRSFGADVNWRISNDPFFAAKTVQVDRLTRFLSDVYITDFEAKMSQMLKRHFYPQGLGGINDTHPMRMDQAINNFYLRFMSDAALDKMKTQVKSACMLVEGMIQSENNFKEWGEKLVLAAEDLQYFFSEGISTYFEDKNDVGSAYASVLSLVKKFAGEDWAKSPIDIAKKEANEAKEAADSVKKLADAWASEMKNAAQKTASAK